MSEKSVKNKPEFLVTTKIDANRQQHGWLSPNGAFIICNPDEHDACAEYIYRLNGKYFEDKLGLEIKDLPARAILGKSGYVKVAGSDVDFYNLGTDLSSSQYLMLKQAGYVIPESLDIDPIGLLPPKQELVNILLSEYPISKFEDLANRFYLDPFNGCRTEDLDIGRKIFEILSGLSTRSGGEVEKIEIYKKPKLGIFEMGWKKLGDGRVVLAYEVYEHYGDTAKYIDITGTNITIFVNTPKYVENRYIEAGLKLTDTVNNV